MHLQAVIPHAACSAAGHHHPGAFPRPTVQSRRSWPTRTPTLVMADRGDAGGPLAAAHAHGRGFQGRGAARRAPVQRPDRAPELRGLRGAHTPRVAVPPSRRVRARRGRLPLLAEGRTRAASRQGRRRAEALGPQKSVRERWIDAKQPVRANLDFFISLRNKIEHRYARQQQALGAVVGGQAQALLLNYEEELTTKFGSCVSLATRLRFPVFIGSFTTRGRADPPPAAEVATHHPPHLHCRVRGWTRRQSYERPSLRTSPPRPSGARSEGPRRARRAVHPVRRPDRGAA
jgi:hypothetical protein